MQQEKQTPAPAGERAENTALSVGAGDPSAAEELSAREAPAADRAADPDGAVNADGSAGADGAAHADRAADPDGAVNAKSAAGANDAVNADGSAGADGEVNAKSAAGPDGEGNVDGAAGADGAANADRAAGPDGSAGAPEGYTRAELRGRRRKNIIFGLVSLAIIACVISVLFRLGDTLAGGDSATFAEMLAGLDWRYLLVVVALFVVAFVCDSLKYTLLNRCNGYSLGFHKDMKMALTGKYYENITPTGTGGQPMQIYYLYKQGVPGAKSTSVTMVKYGIQMLAWTIFGAVVMIALAGTLGEVEETAMRTTIRVCAWVGFGINAFIPVFVTFVIFCPRAVSWLINLVIRLLHKIRLIKNADKLEVKIRSWMDDFSVFSQFVYKRPLVFLLLLALCFVEPVTEMLIPYFLLVALCGQYVTPGIGLCLTVVGLAMYATNAATFIPTPGNSGAIESVFMLAFAGIAEGVIFWYVLIWRFVLYYSFIVLGVGMNLFDVTAGILRRRREKRRARAAGGESARE